MKVILKVQSIALVLLLLCSVCIAPVLASTRTEVIEDGVHLLKSKESSTVLDPSVYKRFVDEDFVVVGNQNYWVRIGSVKAKTLSTNDIAKYLCYGGFVAVSAVVVVYGGAVATAGETTITTVSVVSEVGVGGSTVVSVIQKSPDTVKKHVIEASVGVVTTVIGMFSGVCDKVATYFVDSKYRALADDGTILVGIAKTNTVGISALKKDGLDIATLTLLSTDGKPTPNTIASKLKKIELVKKSELKPEPTLKKSEKQNTLHLPNLTHPNIKKGL